MTAQQARDASIDHAVRVLVEERFRLAYSLGELGIADLLASLLVDARQAVEDIDTLAASGLRTLADTALAADRAPGEYVEEYGK